MTDIVTQIIIFCAVTAIGAVTRLLYLPAAIIGNRVRSKLFSAIVEVLIAVIGAAGMMLVCFLLAGNVRVFYALFFIGGLTLMHMILKRTDKTEKKRERRVKVKKQL